MKNIFAEISANSLPKTPWREIYTKQIPTETSTKKVLAKTVLPQTPWREISTKQFSKETPQKNIFDEKIYQKKKSTNKYVNIKFDPNMSEEKFARKKDSRNFGGKSSPIYPWRIFFGNYFLGETIPQNSHQSTPQQIPEDLWKLFAESLDKSFFAAKKIPIGNFQNPKSYNCLITVL